MSSVDISVDFCGITLKNPVVTASGTFGSGKEYGELIDLNRLGGITCKGVSITPWIGNKPPRLAEVYGGMLNSIGLQNPGVEEFIKNDIPFLEKIDTVVIANVCGDSAENYVSVIERLNRVKRVDMYELNISCPNVEAGGISFGTNASLVSDVVKKCKNASKKPLIVKLSPNVTDIKEIAKAAESAGADGISLINTLLGMKIDIKRRKPVLSRGFGGLSGPCIMPVAVRMVNDVYKSVKIPILGMGGITTYEDALEFIMAGAKIVAVGTANFINPNAATEIIDGIKGFMEKEGIKNLTELCGIV